VEGNVVNGNARPAALRECDGQIANGEKGLRHLNVFLGSKASRTASPMKISSDSMMERLRKPEMPSQGAFRWRWPCRSNSPSDGEPGGMPKPRKSSELSVVIEPFRMKGRKVRVATIALGRRWRNMMVRLETPSARAALTYSKLRARRNSARTTPTKATHEKRSMMPSR